MVTECFFDGAVQPFNPGGHGGYGMLVLRDHVQVFSEAIYVGRWAELSNNVAEYCGAIAALRYLIREGITEATIYGDANIVINQLNAYWKAKGGAYLPYYREAYSLRLKVPAVRFQWIPREQNTEADELSKESITRHPRVVGFQLDPSVEISAVPAIKKRRRTRDVLTTNFLNLTDRLSDDEAWERFKVRTAGL